MINDVMKAEIKVMTAEEMLINYLGYDYDFRRQVNMFG